MLEFLQMGGYAFYVWSAFAAVGIVLAINLIVPLIQHHQLRNKK